jgi:CBS domain-containing protein
MFSVFGQTGRTFHGSWEDLRKVTPTLAISRAHAVQPVGAQSLDTNPPPPEAHAPSPDLVHRAALAAYAQTTRGDGQRHPLSRVEAIMTHDVVAITDSFSVAQAWDVLVQRHLGQVPVLSQAGALVGLFSRADLMRKDRLPAADTHVLVWKALLAQSVADLMWTPIPAVAADTDIRRVARVLLDTGLPGLPVVKDDGALEGFVSRSDILRAVVADPPLDLWT